MPERIIRQPFEGCTATYAEAEIVIVGAGFDGTSSYRPGSRFAPLAIRAEALYSQENFSPYFQRDLTDFPIHDWGDLDLPFGDKTRALEAIREQARQIFADGKKPAVIGGEHLISLPLIEEALRVYPDLHVVQLDAHLDLMDELFGERLSHGTVMRRVVECLGGGERLYQVAIRSGSQEEFAFARQHTQLYPFTTREFLKHLPMLKDAPIYLSVDLDVFDPSLIPGTGTPEAGGIFFPEFMEVLKALLSHQVVAMDLVELAPKIDPTGNSTIHAAKIFREMLIMLAIG